MADQQIVTSIVAKSDFSDLIADVQRVTGSLSKLQREFAGSNRALAGQIAATNAMFKESMLKTGQFSSHFVSLTSDVEKFGRNLDSGRLKLKDYFRVYQDHVKTSGGLIRDLAKQQVQLQNAVMQPLGRNAEGLMQYNVHIPRGLDLTKNKTALLKQELSIMNKVIQDGGVQLINWGKNTQWAGRQLTVGLTLPLVAFGKAAADAFKVADQELTRLTKVYGDVAGTSSTELAKVRKDVAATAKELSSAMGVNFADTISLAADIAATGKTGNELLASVSETTRLAVLGEVDRQEAMKATLAIQSAFKQNTEELSQSINFLNAVENQTSTTLNDLVEAIPKAGPVIKGLGGDVKDLALYLTAMREGGINASEGANALKSALASLINPTDVAVKKFEGFGIDLLGIVKKNAGSTTDTLFALQAALDRLNPLQKQQAIEQLFGKFQYSRLNALFENLGRQGSQTLQVLDLMKASAGELEAVAARELTAVTESASGRYKRAVESLKAELAGVGDEFLDVGTKLINVLTKIIDFAQKLPDPIKKLASFAGAFTAIIGPVVMLTGVLGNFFGYIIKGIGSFKALFKGAEGFKLLTPEIMAAQAAASQMGDEFYSDALAADTLRVAIKKLSEDLILLQKNATAAKTATSGLGQVMTTTAGTAIMTVGGGRTVDPNHPLLGPKSRAAAHLNPRDPNNPATIFGLTMQPIPVNRRIGANPQILMEDRLDDIEGLTTIGGTSTGVVAAEHAKYQALMATLGLQSKREIAELKKTIRMGGTVSADFMATFDDILPITQELTTNAARQSAAIVAELRAGKLSVQQARDAIIAVNAQLERDLGIRISSYGATVGRTIDLTKAPLIDQPVVDPTGKPNTRGMYRKGIFAKVMSALGRATGTKTLGGPYSIETTRPIGRNMGGPIYYNNGDQVPGPNINADVVPAMLTPGEFVIRRDIAQQDPDGMRALNEGRAAIVPFGANSGGRVPTSLSGGIVSAMRGGYGPRPSLATIRSMLSRSTWEKAMSRRTMHVRGIPLPRHYISTGTGAHPASRRLDLISSNDAGWKIKNPATGGFYTRKELQELDDNAVNKLWSGIDRSHFATAAHRTDTGQYVMPALFGPQSRYGAGGNLSLNTGGDPRLILQTLEGGLMHPFSTMISSARLLGYPPKQIDKVFAAAWREAKAKLRTRTKRFGKNTDTFEQMMEGILKKHLIRLRVPNSNVNYFDEMRQIGNLRGSGISGSGPTVYRSDNPNISFAANRGGRVPRFNRGGRVPGYARGGNVAGIQYKGAGGVILSILASLGLYQAGSKLKESGNDKLGSALQFASWLPGLGLSGLLRKGATVGIPKIGQKLGTSAESIPYMKQSVFARGGILGRFSETVGTAVTSGNKFTSLLGKMALGATRLNVALAATTLAVGAGWQMWKNYQETQQRVADSYGMSAERAKKAGLQYTDFAKRIKDAVQAQKDIAERNRLVYESMAKANTPLNITIEQYKKLKAEVKKTMPEIIDDLNKMNKIDASKFAVQLKTQFISMGMSAEEATKKVYAVFSVSNKQYMAGAVIGQKAFVQIKDAASAAASAINLYGDAVEKASGKAQANALNTALTAIETAIQESINKAGKNESGENKLSFYQAMEQTLTNINSKTSSNTTLTQDTINAIKEQNLELGNVLNTSDTIVSTWSKYKLLLAGVNLDLSRLNAQQAITVNNAVQLVTETTAKSLTGKGGILNDESKKLKGLQKEYDNLEKASRGMSAKKQIDSRKRIEFLQKELDLIKKQAEERKKALQEQRDAEDYNLSLQKEQLKYQQAVATGDFTAAAEAQLSIKDLVSNRQLNLALNQIEEEAAAKSKPLEDEIKALQDANQKSADAAMLAADKMTALSKAIETLKTTISEVSNAILTITLGKLFNENFLNTPEGKEALAYLQKVLKSTGNVPDTSTPTSPDQAKSDYEKNKPATSPDQAKKDYEDKNKPVDPTQQGKDWYNAVTKGIENGLKNNKLIVEAQQVVINTGALNQGVNAVGREQLRDILKAGGYTDKMMGDVLNSKDLTKGGQGIDAMTGIIKKLELQAGDKFTYNGVTYQVTTGYDSKLPWKTPTARKLYTGGPVSGPGTKTSDSIPAYLSNGEYVIKADAVNHYGVQTFDALNAKKFKDGGYINPTMGTPDPSQSFWNKLFFGTRYTGGNMKMLKGEVPFGPGNIKSAGSVLEKMLDTKIMSNLTPLNVTDSLKMPGFASTKSLKDFVSSRLFHGGSLPNVEFDQLSKGILNSSKGRGWFGGSLFATDAPQWAGRYASAALAEGKNAKLYELFADLKPQDLLDLRHNAPTIFTQNPTAYKALVEAVEKGLATTQSKDPTSIQGLIRALILEGKEGAAQSEFTSRILPMIGFNFSNVLKEVGIKGIVNRGGWYGSPSMMSRSPLMNNPAVEKGYDILSLFETGVLKGYRALSDFSKRPKLPSFDDGVNNIYTDMVAQLHKNEAVIPAKFNPWNPAASNPLGGDNVTVNMTNTYNIPQNLTKEEVGRYIVDLQQKELARIGINRSR